MSYSFIYNRNKLNAIERFGHICQLYQDRYLIVWGGCNYNQIDNNNNSVDQNLDKLWVFDIENETWKVYNTRSQINRRSGACSIICDDFLYIFGGFSHGSHLNSMMKLNLKTFEWFNCNSNGKLPTPRDKLSGWTCNDRLYFFGGFGPCMQHDFNILNDYGEFCVDPDSQGYDSALGWNSQLIYYDIESEKWFNPKCTGASPQPRAAHSCTYFVKRNKMVLFGGRTLNSRTNDFYILDLDDLSWHGNYNTRTNENPIGRSWMTIVQLNDSELFMYGGFTVDFDPLGDAWVLNIDQFIWTQIMFNNLEKRMWHTAVICDRSKEIYIFGGCCTSITQERPLLPKHILKITRFPKKLKSQCLDYVCRHYNLYETEILINQLLPNELNKMIIDNV